LSPVPEKNDDTGIGHRKRGDSAITHMALSVFLGLHPWRRQGYRRNGNKGGVIWSAGGKGDKLAGALGGEQRNCQKSWRALGGGNGLSLMQTRTMMGY